MKIALTLFNKEDKPMLVMDFDDYVDLRDYWKPRRKTLPKYKVQRVEEDELPAMRAACVGLSPKTGVGWRLLGKDEVIQEGDQWWSSAVGKWETTRCTGQRPAPVTTYRRPFAGDGFRFLEFGETIRSGDEYLVHGHWVPTALVGSTLGKFRNPDMTGDPRYRRKLGKGSPPYGYRILDADEHIEENDIVFNGGNWEPVKVTGHKPNGGFGYFARPINA